MFGPGEEEFEFKPLTSGLGFDQKTKMGRSSGTSSTAPQAPSSAGPTSMGRITPSSNSKSTSEGSDKKDASIAARKVSQIISSLPSLDFLESNTAPTPKPAAAAKKTPAPQSPTQASVLTQNVLPRPGAPMPGTTAATAPAVTTANAGGTTTSTTSNPMLGDIPGLPKRDRQNIGLSASVTAAIASASAAAPSVIAPTPKTTKTPSVTKTPAVAAATASKAPVIETTLPLATPSNIEMIPVETPFHLGAAIFDALVVVGLTCLFAVSLLLITGTDLNIIILNARTDLATQMGIGLLVLSVFALYSIIGRAFCGMTLGEWTFDLQVGTEDEQLRAWYPLAVTARWLFLVMTGLVLFPILSAITKKDLLGRVTGAKLYQMVPAPKQ